MLLIILLYMLMASTFTLGKAVLAYIQPIMFIGMRMMVAGILLLAYQYVFNYKQWRFRWRDANTFGAVAFFLMFISFVAEFWAMQYVTGAKACLLYNASPFITALFAYWFLHERLTRKQIVGLMIGFLGFIPILMGQVPTEVVTRHIGFLSTPELALIAAVVAASYGWICVKQLVMRDYSPIMINGISMLVGGIASFLLALCVEPTPWLRVAVEPAWGLTPWEYALWAVIGYTALLILIANVIGFNLNSWLLKHYSATFISFVGFTAPLFTAFFDWVYLGQVVSWSFWLTIGIVGVGIYIFYQDELKNS